MPARNGRKGTAPVQQVQLDDEHLEVADAIEEAPGSALNSEPVSPSKSAMTGSTTGFFGGIVQLGQRVFSRKSNLEKAQDTNPVEEGEEAEGNKLPVYEETTAIAHEPSTPTKETPTIESTKLKSPSRSSGVPASGIKRKRAAGSERQDLYNVPGEDESDGSEPEEPPAKRLAKRVKGDSKAKKPLTVPITSKGHNSRPGPRTRGNRNVEEVATVVTVPVPGQVNGDTTEQLPVKRKPGRPKKNPLPEPIDEGVSGILSDPSPVKVLQSQLQLPRPEAQQPNLTSYRNEDVIRNSMPELSADEENSQNDEEDAKENAGADESGDEEKETGKTPFDPRDVKEMWEISQHVGKKYDTAEKTWSSSQKEEKLWTVPGKRMIAQLKTIMSRYETMRKEKLAPDKRAYQDAHKEVKEAIHVLSEVASVILSKRLGSTPHTQIKVKETLTDLYFNVLPQWFHALIEGIAVYNEPGPVDADPGSMETAALQELLKLVNLLHSLSTAAVNQPKELQPKAASKSGTYQISQPTRLNQPNLRKLQKSILVELRFREREKQRAEDELLRPERVRQLEEEREREAEELLQRREQRRKEQGKAWFNVQKNHFSGPWNRILQADLAKLKSPAKGKGREESVDLGYSSSKLASSRRAYRQDSRSGSDRSVERVSVFPSNNVKESNRMNSLSKEDTIVFIDCMRYEKGADRYERAAEQIGRSLDEVFAFAKEFQEAMDVQHQEGNFNEARDEWTYDVWAVKK